MTPSKLDPFDVKILSLLQQNGRISNLELSETVGLSPSPCLRRVRQLERAGYISGYEAHINLRMLGEVLTVFAEITLQDHKVHDFQRFESTIRSISEITECHFVSGGYDYLLKFMTRGMSHYQELFEKLLDSGVGIEKYFSYVVIKTVFVKNGYPIEASADVET